MTLVMVQPVISPDDIHSLAKELIAELIAIYRARSRFTPSVLPGQTLRA